MITELDPWKRSILNYSFEDLLASPLRKPSQISAIQMEKVKDVPDKMILLAALPMTQLLEMGATLFV
jgi:hypothetical protein